MKSGLVIEDTLDDKYFLSQILIKAFPGITIEKFSNVSEAWEITSDHHFSIALIDICLPDGNGIDLIKHIKEQSPDTFVVVATICDDNEHLFSALKAGIHGYLLKDIQDEVFIKKLQGILQGEPPLSAGIARKLLRHFSEKVDHPQQARSIKLSPREVEVLTFIAKGFSKKEIAKFLDLSGNTIARYIKDIYHKLNISTRAEAAVEACRLGLVNPQLNY